MNQQSKPGISLDVHCLLDVLTEPAFVVGLEGRVSFANTAFLELDDRSHWLERPIEELFDFETSSVIRAALDQAVRHVGSDTNSQCGDVVVRLNHYVSIFDTKVLRASDNSFVGLLCRQTSENANVKSIWTATVRSVGLGIWSYDAETGIHYGSDVWRELHQVGANDRPLIGIFGAKDAENCAHDDQAADLRRRVLAGDIDKFEYRYRRAMPNGEIKWIKCLGEVQSRSRDMRPVRVVGTENDVTAQYNAELALKQLTSKFELAIAAAEIGIFEFDPENHEVIWDDRMLELYGLEDRSHRYSADLWETLLHPDERADVIAYSDRCLAEKRDFQRDYRIVQQGGEVRWIRSLARYFDYGEGSGSLVGVNMDISEDYRRQEALERVKAQMEHDAFHDALTGLANRRLLDKTQAELSDRCAVMHIDLDEFKATNDTLGHAAGDAVLVHVARALGDVIPNDALQARVGGDEFVILFPKSPDPAALGETAEAVLQAISVPVSFDEHEISARCSIGIAISERSGPVQKDAFVNADAALYQAKAAGRMQYRFYNASRKSDQAAANLSPLTLRKAIDRSELVCHYQPQFDAHTRRLIGAEALVRWQRSATELLPPGAFLPQAEALGMMADIDAHVLDIAVRQLAQWKAIGINMPRISVNISAATIRDETLAQRLAAHNLPAEGLAFELLETIRLDQQDDVVQRNLACIVDQGIGVEIDDFGTAYASILSLQQIKPKRLKIDRALLYDVVGSQVQREIISAIITIARSTGAAVTAEGVETEAQAAVLTELGCDILQGFALARPMDATAFADFALAEHVRPLA